jgi:hypothetical protein
MPDTKQIDASVVKYSEGVDRAVITDNDSYVKAAGFLKNIKALTSQIKDTFEPFIKAAHAAHKAGLDAQKKHLNPLVDAERILKGKMGAYTAVLEAKRKDEEDRLQDEAENKAEEDRQAAIERLKEEGSEEEAQAIQDDPPAPVERVQVSLPDSTPKVEGIQHRTIWKWIIQDPAELPRKFLMPDSGAITAAVRLDHDQEIPGLRIYSEKIIAS